MAVSDLPGQAGDLSFVIDEMLAANEAPGPLHGRIAADRIGVFGLSLGSLTMWEMVFGDCCGDERIQAVIQSDGFARIHTFGMEPATPEQLASLPFPVMIAHSDVDGFFEYADIRSQFDSLPDSAVLLTLHGFLHAAVAENTETPADLAFRQATTVFWDRHLGGLPSAPFPSTVEIAGVTSLEP